MKSRLALFGGSPARSGEPLQPYPGALMIGQEEEDAVLQVIRSKSLFRYYGPDLQHKTDTLEQEFAALMGNEHSLAVTSGTAALKVALTACGVQPGDEVIVPAFTFIASIGAVVQLGAIPVFAEVDESLNLDPALLEERISERTRAVMPVHFSGVACSMDEIMEVAGRHSLQVIEDCAQACGAAFGGRRVGSIGHAGAYSLQLNKIITAGEGGMVTTNDTVAFERAIRYHDQGFLRGDWDDAQTFGENYRMNELTAAVALEQLRKLDRIIGLMRARKQQIQAGISGLQLSLRHVPDPDGDASTSLVFFAATAEDAELYVKLLTAENIACGRPYSGRVAYQTWPQIPGKRSIFADGFPFTTHDLRGVDYGPGTCPNSEDLVARAVFVGISPVMTEQDADATAEGITKAVQYVNSRQEVSA